MLFLITWTSTLALSLGLWSAVIISVAKLLK